MTHDPWPRGFVRAEGMYGAQQEKRPMVASLQDALAESALALVSPPTAPAVDLGG